MITEQDNAAERRRKLWIWLREAGGTWSASEVGLAMNLSKQQAVSGLSGLARAGYVSRSGALPACVETRYAVTGGCLVPMGVTVNEVERAC